MNGGQVILNSITDAQLEALLEVKKAHEGEFQLSNLQCLGGPGFPSGGPAPAWYPGSAWGMGPGHPGQWYGPGSPWGPIPPGFPPGQPGPAQGQSTYNATLTWQQDQGFKAISAVFDRIVSAN